MYTRFYNRLPHVKWFGIFGLSEVTEWLWQAIGCGNEFAVRGGILVQVVVGKKGFGRIGIASVKFSRTSLEL